MPVFSPLGSRKTSLALKTRSLGTTHTPIKLKQWAVIDEKLASNYKEYGVIGEFTIILFS